MLFSMHATHLPHGDKLLTAAAQLHASSQSLGVRATHISDTARKIGPGFWVDGASSSARSSLESLANELTIGKNALRQAGDAVEQAGRFVAAKRPRHEQILVRLNQLGGHIIVLDAKTRTEIDQLKAEQHAIERAVGAVLDQARAAVERSAAMAARHSDKPSEIESFLRGTGDAIAAFGRGAGRFLRGVWDGTWELGKVVVELGIVSAKLSYARMLFDPEGYARDLKSYHDKLVAIGEAIGRDPIGFVREVGKSLINFDDLAKDPAHWAGTLVPTIALALVSGGVGAGAKGAEGVSAVGAAARGVEGVASVGSAASVVSKPTLTLRRLLDDGFDIARWEDKGGFGVRQEGHIIKNHTNPTTQISNEDWALFRQLDASENRMYEGVFADRSTANSVVREFLMSNESAINKWLDSEKLNAFSGTVRFDSPIGVAVEKGGIPMPVVEAKIVLKRSNELPEGFVVQTAYPLYPKY